MTIVTDWRFGKIQLFCVFFPKPSLQHFLVNVRIHYYFNDHGIGFHISIPKCLFLPPRHLFCDSQGDHSHELQDNRPPPFCILLLSLLPPCTQALPSGDWRWRRSWRGEKRQQAGCWKLKNIVLYVYLRKLYRKLFICSGREPSDFPNPLERTTMTTAGWAAASASVAAVGDLGGLGDGHPLSETGNRKLDHIRNFLN